MWQYIQWLKKLIHKRSNFTCEPNCGSNNKGKPMWIFSNKGRYLFLCHAKVQNFSLSYWFNIYFTIGHPQWISFFACTQFGPLCPLALPPSPWAASQSHFYIPPLVFSPIPPAPTPKAHAHQQEGPHSMEWWLVMFPQIFNRVEVRWVCRPLLYIDVVLFEPFEGLLRAVLGVIILLEGEFAQSNS